ncbi:hypothetical protein N7G274_005055 [Stereocaulon virgatum]|uniref:XPG-I domain-containing protein n=1 Tax=Stereocaulon virgatum TaxID=373712 RepID=A0ABR4ACI8_9LECA
MGIPGIRKHIGPGERTALSKLAVEQIEKTGRPLRIAIDISIWQYQIQSAQGGKNPALRTLYYRLLKLLTLSINPLFVFDGPNKPPFKRGHVIASNAACLPNLLTKELLKRFGFPYHTAPGEAEAECALLQKEGLVDAVLSDDVDTLMFGCSMTLRNWTAEGVRGKRSPTHVNVYNAENTKNTTGLDNEGMILVALMSGGDYIPAGVSGCGMRIACEAAKAGFGHELCQLLRDDADGFKAWRRRLEHELRTNESKLFRQRHKTINLPDDFPDMKVLSYYTNPVVSSPGKVSRLRGEIDWIQEVNVPELRVFVAEAFDWQYLAGAKKFVRGLAPALLGYQLIQRSSSNTHDDELKEAKQSAEGKLVKVICGRRTHWNTDGTPELRVAYIPADIVGLNIDAEEKGDFQAYTDGISGDEQAALGGEDDRGRSRSPAKTKGPSTYDPTEIEKVWILETYVKLGLPLLVETWEEQMRNPKKFATRKAREKKAMTKAGMRSGAMDEFVKTTKAGARQRKTGEKSEDEASLPPTFLAPALTKPSEGPSRKALAENRKPIGKKVNKYAKKPQALELEEAKGTSPQSLSPSSSPIMDINLNPWTLAKRPSDTFGFKSPTRYSALGIYPPDVIGATEQACRRTRQRQAQNSPETKRRHSRPATPISDAEEKPLASRDLETARTVVDLSTPTRRDSSKPWPRKKRSPLQLATEPFLASQLGTPTSERTKRNHGEVVASGTQTLGLQKVNRRIDFSTSELPSADSPSLPSPSTLLTPPAPKTIEDDSEPATLPPDIPIAPSIEAARRNVALRESLEGAWKHLEPWEAAAGSPKKVYTRVEVVDLTAS